MVVESEAVGRKNWRKPVSDIHLRRLARSSALRGDRS